MCKKTGLVSLQSLQFAKTHYVVVKCCYATVIWWSDSHQINISEKNTNFLLLSNFRR